MFTKLKQKLQDAKAAKAAAPKAVRVAVAVRCNLKGEKRRESFKVVYIKIKSDWLDEFSYVDADIVRRIFVREFYNKRNQMLNLRRGWVADAISFTLGDDLHSIALEKGVYAAD